MDREDLAELDAWVGANLGEPSHELLTTGQAAERVGVAAGTVRSWASRGWLAPAYVAARRRPYYRAADVYAAHRRAQRLPDPHQVRAWGREFDGERRGGGAQATRGARRTPPSR